MRYSVYNHKKRAYDYYEGVGDVPASGWMRRAAPGPRVVEALAQQLPLNAVMIGSGRDPIGIVATPARRALGDVSDAAPTTSVGNGLALVGLAALVIGALYLGRKSSKWKFGGER